VELRLAGDYYRSTQRREPVLAGGDQTLRAALRKVAAERPRWGYRRAHARLVGEGWAVNRKRVQRLWREGGLRVPARRRKRQRLGESRWREEDANDADQTTDKRLRDGSG
jgi:putative transposase